MWRIYIEGKEYPALDFKWKRKINQLGEFKGELADFSSDDYEIIRDKTATITVIPGERATYPELCSQGRLSKIDYDALREQLEFEAYDFPVILKDQKLDEKTKEWTNIEFSVILDKILKEGGIENYFIGSLDETNENVKLKNRIFTFRIENENLLSAFLRLIKTSGVYFLPVVKDWNSTTQKFDTEKIYINDNFYEKTYLIEKTIKKEKTSLQDRIINKTRVLGRGDGINQLFSENLHATIERTFLSKKLDGGLEPDDPCNIYIEDSSQFPGSGTVDIGMDQFDYLSKEEDADGKYLEATFKQTFTRDGDKSYNHTAGSEVYSALYNETSPQERSSIKLYGVRQGSTYTDKTIVDQDTLDKIAQRIIGEYAMPKELIGVHATTPDEGNMHLGDKISVDDTDYTLTNISYSMKDVVLKLGGGGFTDPLLEEIHSMSEKVNIENRYGAGATNIYQIGPIIESIDNINEGHSFEFSLYIPDEAIAINKVRVNLKSLPFRSYSQIANEEGDLTSGETIPPSTTATEEDLTVENVSTIHYGGWGQDNNIHTTYIYPVRAFNPENKDKLKSLVLRINWINMHLTNSNHIIKSEIRCTKAECGNILLFKFIHPAGENTLPAAYKDGCAIWPGKTEGSDTSGSYWCSNDTAKDHINHTWIMNVEYERKSPCCYEILTRELLTKHQHEVPGSSHSHKLIPGIYEGDQGNLKLEIKKAEPPSFFIVPSSSSSPDWSSFSSKSENLAKYFSRGENKIRISLASSSRGRFQFDGFVQCYIRSK